MNKAIRGTLFAAALLAPSASHAQLFNGGFETGDFSGWTVGGTAPNGVDLDGTPIGGTVYADSEVNVRSGTSAAWGAVNYEVPVVDLHLTQTVPVEELRVYDVGFWQSLGRTSGTGGASAGYRIVVDGNVISSSVAYFALPAGDLPSSFVQRSGQYATSAGQTFATVTFELTGRAGGTAGISYDDFHFDLTPACGDGVIHPSEQCDDGNVDDDDCCSSLCQNANEALPCDDGLFCTVNDTCTGGVCTAAARDCDDGELCTNDSCFESLDTCRHDQEPQPPSSCVEALSVTFKLSDSPDPEDDKLSWKWKLGDAFDQTAVGDPTTTSTYALCVYDRVYLPNPPFETEEARIDLEIPPSAAWTDRNPKGADYNDRTRASDGIRRLRLKTGEDGRTMLKLTASGPNLALPGPALEDEYLSLQVDPVVVELRNSDGACWSSEFLPGHVLENSPDEFSARYR